LSWSVIMPVALARMTRRTLLGAAFVIACCVQPVAVLAQSDPLPSWNDGPSRKSIVEFVTRVTTQGSPDFVPAAERIATFDKDVTLRAEQPGYFQFWFALDRLKALAPQHPEWNDQQPYKALLEGDMQGFAAFGEKGVAELIMATHAGLTTDDFAKIV